MPITTFLLTVMVVSASTASTAVFTGADLVNQVRDYLEDETLVAHPDVDYTIKVHPLDARLSFPACDQLDIERKGTRTHGRVSVAVRCQSPHPWSAFVAADILVETPVVVVNTTVTRGTRLTGSMLSIEHRPLRELRNEFLRDIKQAVGFESRRTLAAGAVLYSRHLTEPTLVNKGERVQIVSRRGAVKVSTMGTALSDGHPGEQISVRNGQSDRVIQAWVEATGVVATSPP